MALLTFAPAITPSVSGIAEEVAPRVLGADFGDGYTQRAGDGLNAIARTVQLTWPAMTFANANAIEAFFEARRGYEAFLWTNPITPGVERKWTAPKWNKATVGSTDLATITATFKQEFDLD